MSPLLFDGTGLPIEIARGRGDLRFSSVPLGMQNIHTAVQMSGGKQVSYSELFATQPWVAAAVMRMLMWAVRVPLKAYRRTGDDSRYRLDKSEHPVAKMLVEPWRGGSQAALIMSLLGPISVHGNSLTVFDEGAGGAIRVSPADWRFARPIMAARSTIAGWKIDTDDPDLERLVPADSAAHVAWWSPLGPQGVSPLQQLGVTLKIEDAAQRHSQGTFDNGARPPSAIIASEQFLTLGGPERKMLLDNLREDIAALYSGPDNAGRPALLPPGLDWKPVGHTAVEAALIDQRKVAREEVCAVYQIPPPMLGILDKATFSNIEVQREMAYTDSLAPPLVLIEQQLNATLVRDLRREDDIYVEFDFAGVLRGDRLKEVESLREAVGTALLTPNEARSIDNRPRSDVPGMDDFYLPMNNLQPVGQQPAQPAQ